MLRVSQFRRLLACAITLSALAPVSLFLPTAAAQDDSSEVPLGDVARNLRKKTPPAKGIIDDDNLSTVMDQIDSRRGSNSSLKFLMSGDSNSFRVSAPDATCSLSFSANAKALLSSQYAQMDLPPEEVLKLDGPATIEGDALTVSVLNGTDWHVSEISVAFTVVKKSGVSAQTTRGDVASGLAATPSAAAPAYEFSPDQVRPEKKPDMTVIYRIRAAAPPRTTTVFTTPLKIAVTAGEEWHWAIVQARGYPPESRIREARTEQEPTEKTSPAADGNGSIPDEPPPLNASPVSLTQPQ